MNHPSYDDYGYAENKGAASKNRKANHLSNSGRASPNLKPRDSVAEQKEASYVTGNRQRSVTNETPIICHYCHKPGHRWKKCFSRQRDIESGKYIAKDQVPVGHLASQSSLNPCAESFEHHNPQGLNNSNGLCGRVSISPFIPIPSLPVRLTEAKPRDQFVQTKFENVLCNGQTVNALVDTGADISVVPKHLVKPEQIAEGRQLTLKTPFGHEVCTQIGNIPLSLHGDFTSVQAPTLVMCAVTDKLDMAHDMLLSANAYNVLLKAQSNKIETNGEEIISSQDCSNESAVDNCSQSNLSKAQQKLNSDAPSVFPESETVLDVASSDDCPDNVSIIDVADANDCPQNKSVPKISHPADFHGSESIFEVQSSAISETNVTQPSNDSKISFDELQKNDESLTRIWEAGREGKHGIVVDRGVLFHIDHVLGERVMQLVVPATKRRQVLKQAHETVWSAHLGVKKTLQRIRYSFWWPDLKKDVQTFVNTCCECQLKARKMRSDEVPITPIQRPESPWEMVNMDCIGPIEPKSASGKRYVLSVIDYATRWPEAVPLSALTAKATCDALLQIFTRTGIPKIIISDCGTNFTSELTCLLEKN